MDATRWPRRVIGEIMLVLILTLVGGWLRLQGLGRDSLWQDEAISLLEARRPLGELLWGVARDGWENHPPLYHLLLHAVLPLGDSEMALRWPSALFGTLSIPLLYWLGRAWFSSSVGLVAALLLTISPFHLWHSQDARMYTLLTLEGLLSWALFSQLLQRPRRSLWAGYGLVATAILYTHYYGALLLLPQTGLVLLLRHRKEVEPAFRARWLWVQAALALLFLPWVGYTALYLPFWKLHWIGDQGRHPLIRVAAALANFSGANAGSGWLRGLRGVLVIAPALAALVRTESREWRLPQAALRERPILLCLGYFAVPIAVLVAISLARPLMVPRHLLMTAPALFVLIAVGLRRLLAERLVIGGVVVLALLVLPGSIHLLSTPRTPDYRGAAAVVTANAMAGDLVLFSTPARRLAFQYYLKGRESRFEWCPQLLPDSSLEMIERCLSDGQRVWMVYADPSILRRQPTFLTPLEEHFHPVRTDDLFRLRVVLHERGS